MDLTMVVDSALLGRIFGASVRHARKAQGMKQEVLAEAVGYSRTRLSEIENGDLPPFEKAVVIANVLGVSLDRLLYPLVLATEAGVAPTFLQRLLRATPQEQRLILDTFQALIAEMRGVVASSS